MRMATILLLAFNFLNQLNGQVILDPGSYWSYSFELHSGNGGGNTQLEILSDTTINDTAYAILYRTWNWETNFPPIEKRQGAGIFGYLRMSNDSIIFRFDNLEQVIWDNGLTAGDSLIVRNVEYSEKDLTLIVDSLEDVQVGNETFRKWYGRRQCFQDGELSDNNEFTYLENVGPLTDYLIWNAENCILGVGTNTFSCWQQNDLMFPESQTCPRLTLRNKFVVGQKEVLNIYPNPVTDWLNVESKDRKIQFIIIKDFFGRIIEHVSVDSHHYQIDLAKLISGTYLVICQSGNRNYVHKLIKY